jgi:hypothetical protein
MRPSNAELLDSIAQALEDQVGPLLQDKWAASTLRSAVQLLRHVAIRGVREPGLLAEDRADVRSVLEAVRARLAGAGLPELEHAVNAALGVAACEPADAAAAAGCDDACQVAVERVIAARAAVRQATGGVEIETLLSAYLGRRLARERELYLPVFLGPPF